MKLTRLAMSIALVFALAATSAYAQSGVYQPDSVSPTSFEYGSYYAQDDTEASPGDVVAEAPGCGCEEACGGCDRCDRGCALDCQECDPWELFPCKTCRGVKINGWISGGVTLADGDPPSNYAGPVTFNDRTDGQINQFNFVIDERLAHFATCDDALIPVKQNLVTFH